MNYIEKIKALIREKNELETIIKESTPPIVGKTAIYKCNGKRYVFENEVNTDLGRKMYFLKSVDSTTVPNNLVYYSDEDILFSLSFDGDKDYIDSQVNNMSNLIKLDKLQKEILKLEKKFEDRLNEINYLRSRGVQHLIHFTRVENLNGIGKYGIVPIDLQEEINIKAYRTDNIRLDGTGHNNLSISFPNSSMLGAKIEYAGMHFAIMRIKPEVLLDEVLFDKITYTDHNAAYSGVHKGNDLEGLKKLFEKEKVYDGRKISRNQQIPDNFTTDPQAEILISGIIPTEYITDVFIKPGDYYSYKIAHESELSDKVQINNTLFEHRIDEDIWKRRKNNGYKTCLYDFEDSTVFCA